MTAQEGRWKCTHKMIDFSKHQQSHGIHEIFPLYTKKEYKDYIHNEIHVLFIIPLLLRITLLRTGSI